MIKAIINGIFKLVISLVGVLLSPIDSLITSALPGLSSAISAVGSFLQTCTSAIGWVLSCFGLSSNCISLIIVYFTFKLTVPVLMYVFKLAIKWYHMLVP